MSDASVSVGIAELARERWLAVAAGVLFVVMSGLWTAGNLHFGSGWIKTGSAYSVNSILGYSETEQTNIVHKENRSFLQQIAMFSGATTDVVDKFYIVRPAYAYAAAFLAPAFGLVGAGLTINLLGWAVAAFCAWNLAIHLFEDRLAGFTAVAFVATCMGFVVHVADYSAHLLAFSTYYLGVVVLYRSGVWKSPGCSRAAHFAIGAYLALCCLTYNMGLALVVAYIVLAFRYNRLTDIALAAGIALSAQYAWVAALNLGYALKTGEWTWFDLYANDSGYLSGSLREWMILWTSPLDGAQVTLQIAGQFLSFEFPLTVAAGIAAVTVSFWRDRQRLFVFFVLFVVPIGGAMAYAQRAAARGYLIFGISLILFVALSGLLARTMRSENGSRRLGAIIITLVLLGGQIAWSGAQFIGQLGPLRAYYNGLDRAIVALTNPPLEAVSLTGEEPRPAWFGGSAQFEQLGLFQGGGFETTRASFTHRLAVSLGSRALISLYITLLVSLLGLLWGWGAWRGAFASIVFIYLLPSVVMAATVKDTIRFVPIDTAGPGVRCGAMRYVVLLSNEFRQKIGDLSSSNIHLELFFRATPLDGRPPQFTLDGEGLATEPGTDDGKWIVKDQNWRVKILAASRLEITYRNDEIRYFGWQRNGLPGRQLVFDECAVSATAAVLPAVELRAVSGGAPVLVGF